MRRRIGLVLGLLLVVVVGFTAYQAVRTATALQDARGQASVLRRQVADQDMAGARDTVRRMSASGRQARENSDDPTWDLASHLPWIGRDVGAVQGLAEVLDDTAGTTLPLALDLFTQVRGDDTLRDARGRFDLPAIARLRPGFEKMAAQTDRSQRRLDRVRAERLARGLRGPFRELQEQFRAFDGAARGGATATRLMPAMLGGEGTRTYLLVAQNNAELRATGGLPGSVSVLRVTDGKIALGAQRAGVDLRGSRAPDARLTREEKALFPGIADDFRDTNIDPDFPRAAGLMASIYTDRYGTAVDGMISIDPVALSYFLRATGPVRVGRDEVTADNAVSILLNRTYQELPDAAQQDAFYARAARGMFAGVVSGRGGQAALLQQTAKAVGERRVLVWSARAAEQRLIEPTTVSGALPRGTGPVPEIGMYLNDATAYKIEYYLDSVGSITSLGCTDDGSQVVRTGLLLTSSVPKDVRGLSTSVVGMGKNSPRGTMRMTLRVFGPPGGTITRMWGNGKPLEVTTLPFRGRRVATVGVLLAPGEQLRVEAQMRTRAGQDQDPRLQLTPTVAQRPTSVTAPSTCG